MANENDSGEVNPDELPLDDQVEYYRQKVEEEAKSGEQEAAAQDADDSEEAEEDGQESKPSDAADESDNDDGTVDKSADDGQKGTFYKSQEEVDRAFGHRLKSERQRWEKEHEKDLADYKEHLDLAEMVLSAFQGLNKEEIREALEDLALERTAEESGLTPEQVKALEKRLGGRQAETKPSETTGELTESQKANNDRIYRQSEELKKTYDFDLMEKLEKDDAFTVMILSGIDVKEALLVTDPEYKKAYEDKLREDARKEYAENQKKRNDSLPPQDKKGKGGKADHDVNSLTEDDLTKLAERVRRGERVVI